MKLPRMTPLHWAVHFTAWLPLIYVALSYNSGDLTANPIQAAEQRTGDAAIVLLLLSLACTPINTLFGFRPALKLRRPLGLYAFMYASIHLFLFLGVDYGFNWSLLWQDIAGKRYIFAGLAAFTILLPMALTSFDFWKKRMGKKWKRLHRLVYLAAVLVVLHLAWVIKGNVLGLQGDIWKPVVAGIVTTLLLVARIRPVRRWLASRQFGRYRPAPGDRPGRAALVEKQVSHRPE